MRTDSRVHDATKSFRILINRMKRLIHVFKVSRRESLNPKRHQHTSRLTRLLQQLRMPRDIDRRLRPPANRRTLQRREQAIGKLHVLTQVVVAEIYVSTTCRFDIANNLFDRATPVHAVVNRCDRTVLARERTTARCLHRIDDDSIFLYEIITRNRKVIDVRRLCRTIAALQCAALDVVEYLRPNFISFADDDRVKQAFDTIRQHRRQITSEHDFLPCRTKSLRYINTALELHDLAG